MVYVHVSILCSFFFFRISFLISTIWRSAKIIIILHNFGSRFPLGCMLWMHREKKLNLQRFSLIFVIYYYRKIHFNCWMRTNVSHVAAYIAAFRNHRALTSTSEWKYSFTPNTFTNTIPLYINWYQGYNSIFCPKPKCWTDM